MIWDRWEYNGLASFKVLNLNYAVRYHFIQKRFVKLAFAEWNYDFANVTRDYNFLTKNVRYEVDYFKDELIEWDKAARRVL